MADKKIELLTDSEKHYIASNWLGCLSQQHFGYLPDDYTPEGLLCVYNGIDLFIYKLPGYTLKTKDGIFLPYKGIYTLKYVNIFDRIIREFRDNYNVDFYGLIGTNKGKEKIREIICSWKYIELGRQYNLEDE